MLDFNSQFKLSNAEGFLSSNIVLVVSYLHSIKNGTL
jgi:hypothetical protein